MAKNNAKNNAPKSEEKSAVPEGPKKLKKVVATATGFHRTRLIKPGETFHIEEDKTGKWFEDFDPKTAPKQEKSDVNKELYATKATDGDPGGEDDGSDLV